MIYKFHTPEVYNAINGNIYIFLHSVIPQMSDLLTFKILMLNISVVLNTKVFCFWYNDKVGLDILHKPDCVRLLKENLCWNY